MFLLVFPSAIFNLSLITPVSFSHQTSYFSTLEVWLENYYLPWPGLINQMDYARALWSFLFVPLVPLLCLFCEFKLLWSSVSHFHVLNSVLAPSLCVASQKHSRSNKSKGHCKAHFVFHLSVITMLHCLVSHVLNSRQLFHIFAQFFVSSGRENLICFPILFRSQIPDKHFFPDKLPSRTNYLLLRALTSSNSSVCNWQLWTATPGLLSYCRVSKESKYSF